MGDDNEGGVMAEDDPEPRTECARCNHRFDLSEAFAFNQRSVCFDCAQDEIEAWLAAVESHHRQKADDRCIEDDDRLYAAFGLPPCDRRVGDKAAMLANCARFIDRRCEGGGWPTYAELEAERDRLRAALKMLAQCRHVSGSAQGAFRTNLRITDAVLAGADVRDVDTVEAIVSGDWKPAAKGGGA
jgi:hypothetical protein